MKTLIKGGLLIDPANRAEGKLNLLLSGGKILSVTDGEPEAERVIDAGGRVVCPGFVDIHMHEDPLESDGRIYADEEKSIFSCMLRMGVTTAVGGNCGQSCCDGGDYLDIVDRDGAAVNVGMMAAHGYYRERAGAADKYRPATDAQCRVMADAIAAALARGCLGVSYGIRYIPGITAGELLATAAPCKSAGKLMAAHIRTDAEAVFAAGRELLDAGRALDIPVQVSHIGSMAGFGQMERFLAMIDEYRLNGLDVSCDCYPYYAFSTTLGSTTYDEGWLDRYHCGYDVVELCEGKYKGRRCTQEIFRELRRDHPSCVTVCHVMRGEDVDRALCHPNVMLGSDGLFSRGQGHPRAAGAFARFLAAYARGGRLPLSAAIARMTALPAQRLGLARKGRLNAGADADIVIFDPEQIADRATFSAPTLAPVGIERVIIAGETAMEDGRIVRRDLGRAVRK